MKKLKPFDRLSYKSINHIFYDLLSYFNLPEHIDYFFVLDDCIGMVTIYNSIYLHKNFNKFPIYLIYEVLLHEMTHLENFETSEDTEYNAYKKSLDILKTIDIGLWYFAIRRHKNRLASIKDVEEYHEHCIGIEKYFKENNLL